MVEKCNKKKERRKNGRRSLVAAESAFNVDTNFTKIKLLTADDRELIKLACTRDVAWRGWHAQSITYLSLIRR